MTDNAVWLVLVTGSVTLTASLLPAWLQARAKAREDERSAWATFGRTQAIAMLEGDSTNGQATKTVAMKDLLTSLQFLETHAQRRVVRENAAVLIDSPSR